MGGGVHRRVQKIVSREGVILGRTDDRDLEGVSLDGSEGFLDSLSLGGS